MEVVRLWLSFWWSFCRNSPVCCELKINPAQWLYGAWIRSRMYNKLPIHSLCCGISLGKVTGGRGVGNDLGLVVKVPPDHVTRGISETPSRAQWSVRHPRSAFPPFLWCGLRKSASLIIRPEEMLVSSRTFSQTYGGRHRAMKTHVGVMRVATMCARTQAYMCA